MGRHAALIMTLLHLGVLVIRAEAPVVTNKGPFTLKANVHPFATNKHFRVLGQYVPTNTIAFQEYGLEVALKKASELNRAWNLLIPEPIATHAVTRFGAYPRTNGVIIGLKLYERYALNFDQGKFERFADTVYYRGALIPQQNLPEPEFQAAILEKRNLAYSWTLTGKQMSDQEVLTMATNALAAVGFSPAAFNLKGPIIEQEEITIEEQTYKVPLWEIRWYERENRNANPVTMEISGVTGTIVRYFNLFEKPLPMPINYWELLGMKPPRFVDEEQEANQ
ncbi:MAG: hypothetical protein SFY81_12685 [Verrucomicrobiota bacterium]|nr:hypothetical protein [Verrucomicrobiota bacterium]